MKNLALFLCTLCFLSFLISGCESTPKTDLKSEPDQSVSNAPNTLTINGFVKDMKTKQSLSGVTVSIGKQKQTTPANGSFSLSYTPGVPISVNYSKASFENLQHTYSGFNEVDQITVYLENSSTTTQLNKSLSGTIFKSTSNLPASVKNIAVTAMVNGRSVANTTSNNNGYYKLNFSNGTPLFQYQYKVIGNNIIGIANVQQRSSIKDSSDIDIIFNETVGGINIDTLVQ